MTGTEPHAWDASLMDNITYVGLDVHKATVWVAVAEGGRGCEGPPTRRFDNRPELLRKLAARLSKGGRRSSFCYSRSLRLWAASVVDRWGTVVVQPVGTRGNAYPGDEGHH